MFVKAFLHDDEKHFRTYANAANAKKAMEKCSAILDGQDVAYLISVNDAGRFYCVALLKADQGWMAGPLAHNGVCVFRN